MTESETSPAPATVNRQSVWFSRLKRLTKKELRETLRDRRTIITLILMPLLVYPILSMVFRTILLSTLEDSLGGSKPVVLKIAFESNRDNLMVSRLVKNMAMTVDELDRKSRLLNLQETKQDAGDGEAEEAGDSAAEMASESAAETTPESAADVADGANVGEVPGLTTPKQPKFDKFINHQWSYNIEADAQHVPLNEVVLSNDVDLGVKVDFPDPGENRGVNFTIVRRATTRSTKAAEYLQEKIRQFNQYQLAKRMQRAGVSATEPVSVMPIKIAVDPEAPPSTSTFSLASLIPLVLGVDDSNGCSLSSD